MFGIPEWALGVGFIMLTVGIMRALTGRLNPPALKGKAARQEVKGLGDTVVDDLQRRLTDVEERLDFAERMLSQQRDAQRLGSQGK